MDNSKVLGDPTKKPQLLPIQVCNSPKAYLHIGLDALGLKE